MRLPRNAKVFRGQLDAAPFASVLLLLLMFFVLQSDLVFTTGVRVNLPSVPHRLTGTTNQTVVVAIDNAGQLYYDSTAITLEKLVPRLRKLVQEHAPKPLALEILADKSGKLDAAFQLMSVGSEIGFAETLLATRPPLAPLLPASRSAR